MPRIEPLYPVDRIVRFRTMTSPTYCRGHVERVATTCAMLMKYSSHDARGRIASGMPHPSAAGSVRDRAPRRADVGDGISYGPLPMSGQETKSKYKDTVVLP